MADRKNMKEYHRKYQQSNEQKEYKKKRYLEKIKAEYNLKTANFFYELHRKTGKDVKNELEIFQMIDECDNTKDIKRIYEKLIKLIKI
jgi:hypothetical protein